MQQHTIQSTRWSLKRVECMQTLSLPRRSKEVVSKIPSIQVTHSKTMLKIAYRSKTDITNNKEIIT